MGWIAFGNRTFECPLAFGDNAARRCGWCGRPLVGRQRRWCSATCGRSFSREHSWTDARAAALRRALNRCERCGTEPSPDNRLEVDHKVPIRGRHAQLGCFHHSSGLMVLCHRCHVTKTAADRAAGLLG